MGIRRIGTGSCRPLEDEEVLSYHVLNVVGNFLLFMSYMVFTAPDEKPGCALHRGSTICQADDY